MMNHLNLTGDEIQVCHPGLGEEKGLAHAQRLEVNRVQRNAAASTLSMDQRQPSDALHARTIRVSKASPSAFQVTEFIERL